MLHRLITVAAVLLGTLPAAYAQSDSEWPSAFPQPAPDPGAQPQPMPAGQVAPAPARPRERGRLAQQPGEAGAPAPVSPAPAPGAGAAGPAVAGGGSVSRYARRGVLEIEGGLSLAYTSVVTSGNTTSTLIFAFGPAVRYFIIDGLALGGRLMIQAIKDGPTTVSLLPEAEYNFNLGGRMFPYVGAGVGFQYGRTKAGTPEVTVSSSNAIVEIGGGVKFTFGQGLIGFGLSLPITFSDPPTLGLNLVTRYAIFF